MTCDLINGSAGVRSIGFGPLGTTWRLERLERPERLVPVTEGPGHRQAADDSTREDMNLQGMSPALEMLQAQK